MTRPRCLPSILVLLAAAAVGSGGCSSGSSSGSPPLSEDFSPNSNQGTSPTEGSDYSADAVSQGPQGWPESWDSEDAYSSGEGPYPGSEGGGGVAAQAWKKEVDTVAFASVTVGGGEGLDLRAMRVTTYVEGLRARTLVDHIYYNPHDQILEGTFRYPLPTEASVSYYAMFLGQGDVGAELAPDFFGPGDLLAGLTPGQVANTPPHVVVASADPKSWGELRVGEVVRSVDGLLTYEEITNQPEVIDPALVEEVAPNTFEARVFPIPANGYNRILIAYEQTLPRIGEALEYAFPIPGGDIDLLTYTLSAGPGVTEVSHVGDLEGMNEVGQVFSKSLSGSSEAGYAVFHLHTADADADAEVLVGTDPTRDEHYFYARVHPTVEMWPQEPNSTSRAVFLVDTSLSEQPGQFNVNAQLLEGILENSPQIEHFNVITFDTGARWKSGSWLENTDGARGELLDDLDGILLEGATDFDAALRTLAEPPMEVEEATPLDVFVLSDGVITWGTATIDAMVARHEATSPFETRFFAYRTGLSAENLELFSALTRQGAIFNCFTADSVGACSTAHHYAGLRLLHVTVEPGPGSGASVSDVLVAGRQATLFPDGTLTVTGRVLSPGPGVLRIQGVLNETTVDLSIPVDLNPAGELAPRAWAEIAVSQLLASRDDGLEEMAMALSQHFRMANRIASFLVLETDEEYDLYDLDIEAEELGDLDVAEAVLEAMLTLGDPVTSWDLLSEVIEDYDDFHHLLTLDAGELVSTLASLATPGGLELPVSVLGIPLVHAADVPGSYVDEMSTEPWIVTPYRNEGERRLKEGSKGAAVRALSSILENNPGSAKLSRLVGYHLGAWDLPEMSTPLFLRVLRKRPHEPQSYRDLANALGLQRPALSAILYEAVLAGDWDAKFGAFQTVVREEYALLLGGLAQSPQEAALAGYLEGRKSALGLPTPSGDLRVTLTWNTDNTDIDLWVTDPFGEKCYYGNKVIASGGSLLEDLTEGYGPERFVDQKAASGEYHIQVQYYANHSNQLFSETFVTVTVMTHVGTPEQTIERHVVVLEKTNDVATIAKVKFP